jgi:hypothetical protein
MVFLPSLVVATKLHSYPETKTAGRKGSLFDPVLPRLEPCHLLLVDPRDPLLHRLYAFRALFRALAAAPDFELPTSLPGREKPLATHALEPRQRV